MNFVHLVKDILEKKLNIKLDKEIGYGAQGEIYSIQNDDSKIIKISILYDVKPESIEYIFDNISYIYNYVISKNLEPFGKIYSFDHLVSGERKTIDGLQKYIIYYSIQEKLQSLTEDEKKVLRTVCQKLNDELDSKRDLRILLEELSTWLEFDIEQIIIFYNKILTMPIMHGDLHRRNIMKNNNEFKLIDLDLATFK